MMKTMISSAAPGIPNWRGESMTDSRQAGDEKVGEPINYIDSDH